MNLWDIQSEIDKFVREKDIDTQLEYRVLDLVSEAGELSKEVLKGTCYGRKPQIETCELALQVFQTRL